MWGRYVRGGWDAKLLLRLAALRRSRPVVDCPGNACWVEPELYCRVACQGWTLHGHLRHPVFAGWLENLP